MPRSSKCHIIILPSVELISLWLMPYHYLFILLILAGATARWVWCLPLEQADLVYVTAFTLGAFTDIQKGMKCERVSMWNVV